jgi:circadian clock protein KaiC
MKTASGSKRSGAKGTKATKARKATKKAGGGRKKPARIPDLIKSLASNVPGLDTVLGGGLPEYSLNLIAGGPGSGKSTLAQQIVFASATRARPAVYFTVLGEPTIKMLRYQGQFEFFDPARVGSAVHYVNLSHEVQHGELEAVLGRIEEEVARVEPRIIVVDSFRTVGQGQSGSGDLGMGMERFVQALAMHLTSWEVTSFLIGEYAEHEQRYPIFTVADGVLWLSQVTDRNSIVRKLQVTKVRGRAPMPGLHTFRITNRGLQIFPRIPEQQLARAPQSFKRQTTGVPGLDELMGGGIPSGDAVMLVGPAGSGKTTFATQFIAEGRRRGESVVIAVFEEYPEEYLARARARSYDLEETKVGGELKVIYLRPLDLSVDETLAEILTAVADSGASRVVIDSLSGFEIALAPAFREDFRESLYRLVGALTATGVTVFMTSEVVGDEIDASRITTERVSFITDDIIMQRFVEIEGKLQKVLAIVKMRGSEHSTAFHTYDVSANGAVVHGALKDYQGIMGGAPVRQSPQPWAGHPGLTESETDVLETLTRLGAAALDALRTRTGLDAKELKRALDRMVDLGYVITVKVDGERAYTAVAQPGA